MRPKVFPAPYRMLGPNVNNLAVISSNQAASDPRKAATTMVVPMARVKVKPKLNASLKTSLKDSEVGDSRAARAALTMLAKLHPKEVEDNGIMALILREEVVVNLPRPHSLCLKSIRR